ncbi:hypothetical protein [Pedobacter nyackensis]|uniref:hypothetical protein n=1 Tax=Pedobacter nyackensis TaxID=475255 RepID=UPI0013563190|nr:hypothetical protein [Pedobacter nyackensis]
MIPTNLGTNNLPNYNYKVKYGAVQTMIAGALPGHCWGVGGALMGPLVPERPQ